MNSISPQLNNLRSLGLQQAPNGRSPGLHQLFQTGGVGPGFGAPSQDVVVALQQMLLQVIGPMLESMMDSFSGQGSPSARGGLPGGGSAGGLPGGGYAGGPTSGYGAGEPGSFGPVVPGQSFGGVEGFFRDVEAGLTQGSALPPEGSALPPQGSALPPGGTAPSYGYDGAQPDPGVGETIPTDLDYRDLNKEQRRELSGMSDRERAVLHLWGIQMTSKGSQDGGVLLNVLENPENFQEAEVQLARELVARDNQAFGGVTGKSLDQEFFGLYEDMTGKDISGRYAGAPIQFAQGPLDMDKRLTGDNGLNAFENQVLQLWGHAPLFNGGRIDGNIVDYALNSSNTLEANLNRSDLEALKRADLASDGVLNGDSLDNAFLDTLDRLYLGDPGASAERTMNDALAEASLRREGLLPPPEPASERNIEALPPTQRKGGGGGACPFLAGGGAAAA